MMRHEATFVVSQPITSPETVGDTGQYLPPDPQNITHKYHIPQSTTYFASVISSERRHRRRQLLARYALWTSLHLPQPFAEHRQWSW